MFLSLFTITAPCSIPVISPPIAINGQFVVINVPFLPLLTINVAFPYGTHSPPKSPAKLLLFCDLTKSI